MHLQTCSAAAWLVPGLAGGQAYACNTGRCVPASSRRTREQEPGASLGSSEPEMPALPVNTQTDPSNNYSAYQDRMTRIFGKSWFTIILNYGYIACTKGVYHRHLL